MKQYILFTIKKNTFWSMYSVLAITMHNVVVTVNLADKIPALIELISGGQQIIHQHLMQCQIATNATKENKVGKGARGGQECYFR